MIDILDYIRAKLTTRPLTPEAVESALSEARQTYGGDMPYVRKPPKQNVSRRTIQRRTKATNYL